MTHWWRAYDDAIDHPKLLKLSDAMHRAWFTLQCIASANGGTLPPAADIAVRLRIKPAKVAEWITKLAHANLIDNCNGVFRPHNWDDRQFQSDSSTSRVTKYRDKRRAAGLPQMGDYTVFRPSLLQRDGERCVYCEVTKGLVVDHMVPIALGGTDHPDNLALACKPCNSGKAGRTPELAGMTVIVTSALDALTRYRDIRRDVTVTATAPEQSRLRADTEQSRADAACAPIDEDLKRRSTAIGAAVSALFLGRQLPIPNLARCEYWLREGYAQGTILGAVEAVLKRGTKPATLDYFDGAIRDAHPKAVPASELQVVSRQVFIIEGTMEWACWERHLRETTGRGSPVTDNRDEHNRLRRGWFRPSTVPPGYDEATGERIAPAEAEDAA